ncbi:MAG: GNAT family N-acetyltransferase [Dehalococcoidales bacterium]|jgi:tagatose 1,6-diphosphate aldolase|nr:GNAT family N-acetyltransferase [Dehalococcoidales bacterium]MDP7525279.1 GNAT family N-acetyltransferase [Dehalococcoidales bacterium]
MTEFSFNDYKPFSDGELQVVVREKRPADPEKEYEPAYDFDMRLVEGNRLVGRMNLRISNTSHITMYAGHIGYGVFPDYRGHHYAARACNLIKPVALDHGLKILWITCNPDNVPSRRTCEILGCEFVEIVDLPEDTSMYRMGERQKCRYRWDL